MADGHTEVSDIGRQMGLHQDISKRPNIIQEHDFDAMVRQLAPGICRRFLCARMPHCPAMQFLSQGLYLLVSPTGQEHIRRWTHPLPSGGLLRIRRHPTTLIRVVICGPTRRHYELLITGRHTGLLELLTTLRPRVTITATSRSCCSRCFLPGQFS